MAKLYKDSDVRVSEAWGLDRVLVNATPGATIPTGYGAESAIYLVFNPRLTKVDARSGASGDSRPGWRYGHSSVYFLHTANRGAILDVTAPDGHKADSFEFTSGALDLLEVHTGSAIPFQAHLYDVPSFYRSELKAEDTPDKLLKMELWRELNEVL